MIHGFDLYPDLAHLREVGRCRLGGCLLFCALCHETRASAALHFDRKAWRVNASHVDCSTAQILDNRVLKRSCALLWLDFSAPLCWYFLSNPAPFMALFQLCLPGRRVTTYPKAGHPLARISMRAKESRATTVSRSAADFREESRMLCCFLWQFAFYERRAVQIFSAISL